MVAENLYKILNILITSFVAAGGLGFINFVILEKLDIIRQDKEQKDEKILFILFFSIVNYALFLLIFSFPKEDVAMSKFISQLSFGVLVTLATSVMLSFSIYPMLAKILKAMINVFRKKILKKPKADNQTPKERLFSASGVSAFVYIFDFEEKKLGEGYLEGWLNDTETKNQVVLTAPESPTGHSYEQVQELFSQLDNDPKKDTTRHLIDFDNKIHYFIIYQLNLF